MIMIAGPMPKQRSSEMPRMIAIAYFPVGSL
jgi:hypothetical protein